MIETWIHAIAQEQIKECVTFLLFGSCLVCLGWPVINVHAIVVDLRNVALTPHKGVYSYARNVESSIKRHLAPTRSSLSKHSKPITFLVYSEIVEAKGKIIK
jgi:hypothetical protein